MARKRGIVRAILLGLGGVIAACCGLGAFGAVIGPPSATPTPGATARTIEPAQLVIAPSATAAPTTAPSKTPAPTPVASFTPEPTRTLMPTPAPTATRAANTATPGVTAAATKAATALPTRPPATFTPKPAPTAAPLPTAVPTPSGPVYTQEGPSRRRVDPAWWPCSQGQIKGNNNSRIYHAPGMRDYAYTFSNVTCFRSEADAVNAGFRRAQR